MSNDLTGASEVELERMFGALLRIPFQAMVAEIESSLTSAGFTDLRPAHFAVFQHLPAEGARLTRLAEDAQMTKQSMGELVRYLEARGYIKRAPDPTDRRAQIIDRTPRGWEIERIARSRIAALVEEWRRRIGAERFDQMWETLNDLVALIEGEHSPVQEGPDIDHP